MLLLGLVCAIFGEMLPDYTGSVSNLFAGVALVVLNTMTSLAIARRAWTIKTIAATFAARLALNIAFATVANWILDNQIDGWDTLFFLTMISLITTLHDRWRPIHEFRTREPAAGRLA
ncbi:hypothetical protein [Paractinoplanes hotanensis]|uniref:ATP synthase protein I n=1 Tax=Paractinoplanes hotanensis TaxID=2906497 RepID=A0ABT0XS73_9ACTN|nr:hypothetical protein [Actinoplanes hotanensis]MCM4076630.1 hypothetical protein [Actinoplanes hotanensis]